MGGCVIRCSKESCIEVSDTIILGNNGFWNCQYLKPFFYNADRLGNCSVCDIVGVALFK